MNQSILELQVYYEIAMSIGNSIDLRQMLQESLTAYLQKLNCSAGAVFKMEREEGDEDSIRNLYRFQLVYSIPRKLERNPTCRFALELVAGEMTGSRLQQFKQTLPINGQYGESHFYHILELPNFGLLLLVKNANDLEQSVLRSLHNLNKKLAGSCIACLQNEKVKQYNQQLKTEIEERRRMEAALVKAKKLEAIGTLAGGVAHDFNNLLSIITGNVSLIKMDMRPRDSFLGKLNAIEDATMKARDLTQKFITFSTGGMPVRSPLSIRDLLENLVSLEFRESRIVCRSSFSPDIWMVKADEGQMKQVFFNILENAKEAMPHGGTIEIDAENTVLKTNEPHLPLSAGSYVKIIVRDEGSGISEENAAKIFDPFFSTKQRGEEKGTGLGLTIAYSVVKKHGGFIHVESRPGTGTTVTVYLPAYQKKLPGRKKQAAAAPNGKKRILVMDDEAMVRDLSAIMLKRLGYEAELAKNGDDALKIYKQALTAGRPIDIVILDLTVRKGMDGEKTMGKLLAIDPQVNAIVTSGYFNSPIIASFAEHGFKAALLKPFRIDELKKTLANLLG